MNKKNFILLLILTPSIILFNCKKDDVVNNNPAPQYMTDLLTQDTLEFESYILHWNRPFPDTFYKRGYNRNRLNFDTLWLKFDKDGTFKGFISHDYQYSAQWQFLDGGSKLRLWNSSFNRQVNVIKLSKDTIEWLDVKTDSLFYQFKPK